MTRKSDRKPAPVATVDVVLLCIYGGASKGATVSVAPDEAERLIRLGAAKAS